MKIKIFQVDAFTDKLFGGNPAAACPLEKWIDDRIMQSIAFENNLSETAFYVGNGVDFEIRWFTPTVEVDLCGHATLAAAHVLYEHYKYLKDDIVFNSRSGALGVFRNGNLLTLNFPTDHIVKVNHIPPNLIEALHLEPKEIYKGNTDFMVVYETQKEIEALKPDLKLLATIAARGIIVTSEGNDCDFVSRFFAPQSGIDEDPVTGSAHTTLVPYWSKILNKQVLHARQLSLYKV